MNDVRLSSRLLIGALAGITATTMMTAAMRRLHAALPKKERYPLPPREITERLSPDNPDDESLRDRSLVAHFAYGAATGAVIGMAETRPRESLGALLGAGVWTASYFGWVPAFGVLRPANDHPRRRNALMIGVHLVWGAVTAWTMRELTAARETIVADGPLRDAPRLQTKEGGAR